MHATNPTMDDPMVTGTYGELTVRYQHAGPNTWTVTVEQRTLRLNELCQTFTTPHAAWAEAQRIATAAFAGTPVEQITADRPGNRVVAEAERIVNTAARTLADTVPAGPINALCHASGVKATSDPMDRIIAAATMNGGLVERSAHATSTQLVALKKRGLLDLTYTKFGRTRKLTGATLTVRGWAHAARLHKAWVPS